MAEEYRGRITSAISWDRALTQEEIDQICQNSPTLEESGLVEDREFEMDFTFDSDPFDILRACGIDVDFLMEESSELPGEIDYSEVDGHTIDEMREIIGKWKGRG